MLYDKRWELETPPFAPLERWQRVLLQAADILEREGWCQGHYHYRGKFCAIGAISVAARLSPGVTASPRSASYKACQQLKAVVGPVGQWNDSKGRTVAEVVATMREVARSG